MLVAGKVFLKGSLFFVRYLDDTSVENKIETKTGKDEAMELHRENLESADSNEINELIETPDGNVDEAKSDDVDIHQTSAAEPSIIDNDKNTAIGISITEEEELSHLANPRLSESASEIDMSESVAVGDIRYEIDLKSIQPYKNAISHGGLLMLFL